MEEKNFNKLSKWKWKVRAFIVYILLEPWFSKISFPNLRMLNWIAIILSIFVFKSLVLFGIFVTIGIIFHIYGEWKSGNFIYWLRMRDKRIRKWRETIKEIRLKRRENEKSTPKDLNSIIS